jgi:hypothetical protein
MQLIRAANKPSADSHNPTETFIGTVAAHDRDLLSLSAKGNSLWLSGPIYHTKGV